ncbi:MAG: S8 family serine peptidase [Candidatus Eisenbacteria bacterium]|nr:S8 family serine peptidase [Candidatus Eisenbacteria bacterium]
MLRNSRRSLSEAAVRRLTAMAVAVVVSMSVRDAQAGSWTDPSGKHWDLTPVAGEWLLRFGPDGAGASQADDFTRLTTGVVVQRPLGAYTRTAIVEVPAEADAEFWNTAAASLLESAVSVHRDEEGFRKYFLPDRITVQFRPGISIAAAEEAIEAEGCRIVRRYRHPGYYQISVPGMTSPEVLGGPPIESTPGSGDDVVSSLRHVRYDGSRLEPLFEALRAWSARPEIRFAEPVYFGFDDALGDDALGDGLIETPNDPFFPNQWGLRNPGNGAWEETADVWADGAWWITKGDPDVVIAFVDTGMDLGHEDLAPNLFPQNGEDWDFLDPDNSPQDLDNHGTLVTGIASAVQGNALGISGYAPECRIMPLRVSLDEGEIAERVDAIQYCAARSPDVSGLVVNCSWGNSSGDFTSVRFAIQDAAAAGCVVVCSAGNSNSSVIYPARYPEPIAVGATSPCDERKRPGSCDGESWGSCFGPELDVVAPGVKIWTTDRTGNLGLSSTNYWAFFNGTSASAPFVSALAALVLSVDPSLGPEDVRAIIEGTADDEVGFASEDLPGFDEYMGWGRINGWKALVLATHPEGIEDDVEDPDPYWRHQAVLGDIDTWHLSEFDNHTVGGVRCWSSAAESSGTYLAGTDAALYLPDLWVPELGELRFWHRMEAYEITPTVGGDGGFLELSPDGGESWVLLSPEGGYDHTMQDLGGDPFPAGQPVFSGSFDWEEEIVDLSSYSDSPVRIRFRFGSRSEATGGEVGFGWRIDDVRVGLRDTSSVDSADGLGVGADGNGASSHPFGLAALEVPAVFHDGATVRFALDAAAEVHASVHTSDGRRVRDVSLGPGHVGQNEADLGELARDLSSGPYWLRLRAGGGHATARFVVVD